MWTFDDDLGYLEIELESRMKQSTREAAQRALDTANVPVETGNLKASGHVIETSADEGEAQTTLEYSADYASEIEDGHMSEAGHFVRGTHFLGRAMIAGRAPLTESIANHLMELGCSRVDRFF